MVDGSVPLTDTFRLVCHWDEPSADAFDIRENDRVIGGSCASFDNPVAVVELREERETTEGLRAMFEAGATCGGGTTESSSLTAAVAVRPIGASGYMRQAP